MSSIYARVSRALAVAPPALAPGGQYAGRSEYGDRAGVRQRRSASAAQSLPAYRDWSLLLAAALTAVVGLLALYVSYRNDWILIYQDAASHLNIARRVFDSRTPGIVMLGTVWLPVPHILLQPFVYNDFLYYSGLAGGCTGFLCFEATAIMLFLSIRLMVRRELAAWVGLGVFISNPNVLYLQTTALTEPVLMMTMTASSYFLLRWSKRDSIASLLMAGLLAMLAIGSRYDGWFFAVACGIVVALNVHMRWRNQQRTEGVTLAYLVFPTYAIVLWFLYNWLIFGDALAFQRSQYSAAFQQEAFAHAGLLPTKGHLLLSAVTYSWAVLDNLGGLILAVGLVGLITYMVRMRLRPDSFVPYTFLSAYPFNILALYLGQTILWTPHTTPPGYFNTRYGFELVPAAVVFIAYFADVLMGWIRPYIAAAAMAGVLLVHCALLVPNWPNSVTVVADGLHGASASVINFRAAAPAARYMQTHYKGGGILTDTSTWPWFVLQAKIDMRAYIDAYSGALWTEALRDPTPYVEWIILHPGQKLDRVLGALEYNPNFTRHYTAQFKTPDYVVYRRKESPAQTRAHRNGPMMRPTGRVPLGKPSGRGQR